MKKAITVLLTAALLSLSLSGCSFLHSKDEESSTITKYRIHPSGYDVELSGHISMSKKDIDSLYVTIGDFTLKIGDPVSKIENAGWEPDDRYTNNTIDSSHYALLSFRKNKEYFIADITTDSKKQEPILNGKVCGFMFYAASIRNVTLSDGIPLGLSFKNFKEHVQSPEFKPETSSDSSGEVTSYDYFGSDQTNQTVLYVDIIKNNYIDTLAYKKIN